MSVPIGFENGLPLAFQIAGKPFDEAAVLRAGYAFEQASDFRLTRPPLSAPLPGRADGAHSEIDAFGIAF